MLGDSARDMRDWKAAIDGYQEFLKFEPRSSSIQIQLGHVLKEDGQLVAASEAYFRALSIEPGNDDLHLQIGHLRKLQGDMAAAARAYRAALRINSENVDAANELTKLGFGLDVTIIVEGEGAHAARAAAAAENRLRALEAHGRLLAGQITNVARGFQERGAKAETVAGLSTHLSILDSQTKQQFQSIAVEFANQTKSSESLATHLDYVESQWREKDVHLQMYVEELDRWRIRIESSLNTVTEGRREDLRKFKRELEVQMQGKLNARLVPIFEQLRKLQGSEVELSAGIQRADQFAELAKGVLRYLEGRAEFIRRELMYEMHCGLSRGEQFGVGLKASGSIKDTEKVAKALKSGLRLNLGCGHIPLEGYINVDRRDLPGIDIVAEVDELPLESKTAVEIRSAHLIEHFPQEELVRKVLPYWRSLLVKGGVFRATVPDGKAMLEKWSAGEYPFEEFRQVLFGAQDYMGDYHYNILTPESLSKLLEEQGFSSIRVVSEARRNGACFEFEIEAKLP